jgi:hypothetical protein
MLMLMWWRVLGVGAPCDASLLTGQHRAATVQAPLVSAHDVYVLEVSQEGLQSVLARRPNLARAMADVVAERSVKNLDSFRAAPEDVKRQRRSSMVGARGRGVVGAGCRA